MRALLIGSAVLASTVCGLVVFGFVGGATQPAVPSFRVFQGAVVDQDGQIVRGAEIVVTRSKLVPGYHAGSLAYGDKETFSVYTGVAGRFAVMLPDPIHVVTIEKVKKDGYEWVVDWAWNLQPSTKASHAANDNRMFVLAGERWRCPAYEPDVDRPAVFPVHRVGAASPASRPSRGGSERLCDRTRVVNEPAELHVPSAGPGAPRTHAEISAAIGAYVDRREQAAATRPAGK